MKSLHAILRESVLEDDSETLDETKGPRARKPAFGTSDRKNYAVKIDSLDDNNFLSRSFGQQLSDLRKVQEWMKKAKKGYAGAKGKSTMPAVKKWIKENKPTEFYARWPQDTSSSKDDSVEIFYTGTLS